MSIDECRIMEGGRLKKDGAKPPARRGCSAYASESDIHQYSICNLQFSILRLGGAGSGCKDKLNMLGDRKRLLSVPDKTLPLLPKSGL